MKLNNITKIVLFAGIFFTITFLPPVKFTVYSTFSPISYPIESTKILEDEKYNILTRIPIDWNIRIAFINPQNDNGIIEKRIMIERNEDTIVLDIWSNPGKEVLENYQDLEGPFFDVISQKGVNGKINGFDAVLSSALDTSPGVQPYFSGFFQSTDYIYRIGYSFASDNGLENFLSILSTFKLKDRQNINEFTINNLDLPKRSINVSFGFLKKVLAVTNCGSYSMSGNPFPCCVSGGNCTWWAIYKRQDLKDAITHGDAGQDWITQADQANIPVFNEPTAGAIAVWGPSEGRDGHVAYVNSVSGNNAFNVSEMNCSGSAAPGPRDTNVQKNYKDAWVLTFLGFIGGQNPTIIQNVTITFGTYTSPGDVRVESSSTLNPVDDTIILGQ